MNITDLVDPPWNLDNQLRRAMGKDRRRWSHDGGMRLDFRPFVAGYMRSPRDWAHVGQEDPVVVYDNFMRGQKADLFIIDHPITT